MSKKWKVVIYEDETVIGAYNDVNCIIGAFGVDTGVHQIFMTSCDSLVMASALMAIKDAHDSALERHPEIGMLIKFQEMYATKKEEKES